MKKKLYNESIEVLQKLIATQSFSGEEQFTAEILTHYLKAYCDEIHQKGNNIWVKNLYFDETKPTILLNSHHDTVKPNKGYTKNPFQPEILDGKLFGLGSNDAGGCLVSLVAAFLYFYKKENLAYNLVLLASAEEESSGENGIRSVLSDLPKIDFAIVGEPTSLHLAIAEKGLLVLDCYAHGTPGHAAHSKGDNSIYHAMDAIHWFKTYHFPEISETLGEVKMTVTQIEAGDQHNVVPSTCHFVVDIRVTDKYSNLEVLEKVKKAVKVEVKERSLRLNSSFIPKEHPIVQAGIKLGRETYGSPTLSDQSNLTCHSLKLGPGDSLRSHTADEYIYLKEIEDGITLYIQLLEEIL
ncbi:M20 family metallo-hydrolase [Namhaeicola litoreus]|uniref:M20 family metallo-hydrolase n=1 Tax=Namhaeicola litoreus TaxID=1052145 RepID=A0ABW3XYB7_9FLAO